MFLLHVMNYAHQPHTLRFAADEVKFDANLDELPEIEEGLQELEEASHSGESFSGPYGARIRAKLLSCSSNPDVEEAVKEWTRDGAGWKSPGGTCELCGKHPISFRFPIKNRVTGTRLVVGSECIYNYLKIAGFGSMEELRRRLNGERARLKKKETGELSEKGLAIYQEAADLETQLRARFSHLASGASDFDWLEYRNTLTEVTRVVSAVNAQAPVMGDINRTLWALRAIARIHENLSRRSKLLKTHGLLAMVSAAMRLRDDALKLDLLKQLQAAVNDMVGVGYPTDFVKRVWDDIKAEKANMIEKIEASAESQRQRLTQYDKALDQLKPYEFLHFSLIAGLNAARKMVEKEADAAKALVLSDDFIKAIMTRDNPISKLLGLKGYDPLYRGDDSLMVSAVKVSHLPELILYRSGGDYLSYAISRKYGLKQSVKDRAGLQVACFRLFDDGLLEIEDPKALSSTISNLVESGNKRVIDILEQEVDDLKPLKKRDLWELLSDRWEFDVQKALKGFSQNVPFEDSFARSLVANWQRWPKLSPKQMTIIQRKLTKSEPARENMWDVLKGDLLRPAPHA